MDAATQARATIAVTFVLDSAVCGAVAKVGTGIWEVSLYFALRNSAPNAIRITNLCAELNFQFPGTSPALTTGAREVVDLRASKMLLQENKFYDLAPGEEQPICGKLGVVKWFRIPSSRMDGDYAMFFSLWIDYRVISADQTYRVAIPVFYYLESNPKPGQSEGSLLCITEHNVDQLIAANQTNEEFAKILKSLKHELEARVGNAELVWAASPTQPSTNRERANFAFETRRG